MRYLTFALTKGRLANKTLDMFEKIGITCEEMRDKDSRKLIFTNEELKLRFFLAKGPDVPTYVEYVDRRVRAVVDARDDQRRHLLAEHHAVESDFHAVDRRAVAGIHAQARLVGYLFQIQRPRQRNGVPHAALRLLGGDDQQAGLLAQRLDQHAQSLRVHSVVVGQKYQRLVRRLLACLFHRQQR